MPIITLRWSSSRASMAAAPIRDARMRSWAVGEPPRCRWPRIDTRTSYCGYSFSTRSAIPMAPPVTGLSATSTIDEFLLLRNPFWMRSANWSTSVEISGIIAASAPDAIAPLRARKPASRPITSIKNRRSWDVAVSRILSTHSIMVLRAVSYPIVVSVPKRSLSIVPGRPIIGKLNSLAKIRAPVSDPSPPITTKASIPWRLSVSKASWRPSGVLNSLQRAVFRIVPPRCMMFDTLAVVNS